MEAAGTGTRYYTQGRLIPMIPGSTPSPSGACSRRISGSYLRHYARFSLPPAWSSRASRSRAVLGRCPGCLSASNKQRHPMTPSNATLLRPPWPDGLVRRPSKDPTVTSVGKKQPKRALSRRRRVLSPDYGSPVSSLAPLSKSSGKPHQTNVELDPCLVRICG